MNKTATLLFTILLIGPGAIKTTEAQQRIVEKTLTAGADERIELNLKFGENIIVKGWDKNEVSFGAVVEINSGKLNDAFVVSYAEDNRGIQIETDFDKKKLKSGRSSDCPDSKHRSYWNSNENQHMVCSNITFEIYIPRNSDLKLETIAADVELVDLNGPIDAKSISGFVDLSWPDRKGAEVSLKTITGEAYSNLNNLIFNNRKEHFPHVGYELRGAIGSGGPIIKLESVSGDLYLRKTGG